jgi:endonuclease YncB( thermonuclease family)
MKNPLSRTPLSILLLTLAVCVSVFAQTVVFPGRVVDVADGDTVTVLTQSNAQFQVRCHGINAPKAQDDFASLSRQRLIDLLMDQPVIVRVTQRDQDGTLVGTILLNGSDICLDQVRTGMAWYDDQSEQSRSTKQQYTRAESGARSIRAGSWSVPLETNTSSSGSVVASPSNSASLAESTVDQRLSTTSASSASTLESSSNATVNVRGYFRKDGTYVAGHQRTAPDGNFSNNWSTEGNVNPYTGKVGTKKRSRWITALKWIGAGAAMGTLMYLDAKYATATAKCNDGTYSYSQHRRGTCSYHGGVAYWLR